MVPSKFNNLEIGYFNKVNGAFRAIAPVHARLFIKLLILRFLQAYPNLFIDAFVVICFSVKVFFHMFPLLSSVYKYSGLSVPTRMNDFLRRSFQTNFQENSAGVFFRKMFPNTFYEVCDYLSLI